MPGIGCIGTTCGAPEIGKSGFSEFQKSGFPEIWKSGHLKIRILGFPEIRIFGNRISENPENPELRIFKHFIFPDFREIGQSKKSKKASNVEFAYVEFPLKSMVIDMCMRNLVRCLHHLGSK